MKEFLSRKGVPFQEKNVLEDEEAMAELERLRMLSTPVTVIDGEVIVGFDRERLERLTS